jgi:hypothetical protein
MPLCRERRQTMAATMAHARENIETAFVPFRGRLPSDRFKQLYDYWQRKRGTRPMPARCDIDPLELKGVLGWVLLLDVERPPLRFRFRLIGSEITTIRGVDLTGKYLEDSVSSSRDILLRFNARVATEPCIGFHCVLDTMKDAKVGWVSRLSLPLSSDRRRVDMILGGFHYTPGLEAGHAQEHFQTIKLR